MAKLYLDLSGRKGLALKHNGDVNDTLGRPQLRYLGADGQMAQGIYDPIRNYGYLSPVSITMENVTENDATSAFTDTMTCSIYDSTSQLYFWGERSGAVIWRQNASGTFNVMRTPTSLSFPIAGTGVRFTDLEIYQKNGSRALYFTYQKSGGGDMGIIPLNSSGEVGAGSSATYLSGTATGGANIGTSTNHFMRTSDNGFMYIFDGQFVHKFDGTAGGGANGTLTANVLTFPAGMITVDAVDWRGLMWTGVQTSDTLGAASTASYNERIVGVYVWDRQSTVVNTTDFIPLQGVKEIRKLYVTASGEMRAIVISSERFMQIRRYNGATFETIASGSINAYPVYHDSFTLMGELATWLAADGRFYAHGRIAAGEPEGLYVVGDITATTSATPSTGSILLLDANFSTTTSRTGIMWNATQGATAYNKIWFPHGQGTMDSLAQQGHAGDVYTLVKYLPKLSTLNYINIYCAPTSSATSTTCATVTIYLNQSTVAFKTYTVPLSEASRGYITIPIRKPYVNAVQVKISFATGVTLGNDDFLPAYAEFDYTAVEPFK